MDLVLELVQDVNLLALCTWREARAEPYLGKLAVAACIMNRVKRPTWWGHDVSTVVHKKWQFSSMTDPNDPQLKKLPTPYEPVGWRAWEECLKAALDAYNGESPHPAPGADSYYATYIKPPRWADEARFIAQIGGHRFFDLDADHERATK